MPINSISLLFKISLLAQINKAPGSLSLSDAFYMVTVTSHVNQNFKFVVLLSVYLNLRPDEIFLKFSSSSLNTLSAGFTAPQLCLQALF